MVLVGHPVQAVNNATGVEQLAAMDTYAGSVIAQRKNALACANVA
jgi:hypothetical protein